MDRPPVADDQILYPDLQPSGTSEYGSDFDSETEQELSDLLSGLSGQIHQAGSSLVLEDIEEHAPPPSARVPRSRGQEQRPSARPEEPSDQVELAVSIEGGVLGESTLVEEKSSRDEHNAQRAVTEATPEPGLPDLRSPLARFRTAPKKTLSVTDLISPSWCELQYWYTLTKHGKKRRTPAMRQGSVVHKILEDEVHRSVPVEVTTKEDSYGLRIWNIIEGLRTLRETGQTREIEVWGVVDGLVVNGVIDELSYICPDRELEEQASRDLEGRKSDKTPAPANQASIESFLLSQGASKLGTSPSTRKQSLDERKKVYVTDVKTRSSKSLPSGASFRPTLMQLMIYRRLLSDLASNRVDPFAVFNRYDLNPHAPFTDSFIAQVANLQTDDDPSQASFSTQDSMHLLLEHNSLHKLWGLLTAAFKQTFPAGAVSVAQVLKAEYRDPVDGTVYGAKTFLHNDGLLQSYLEDEIRWWRGEREPVGVVVEEAYKCRMCEFAEGCSWREGKVEEATRKHRSSQSGKTPS
ncbi:MAG: hypothetical protein M4579_003843 [Chaenotheca gracillima]|nr:MAG: hypothetical protein M4579_003843 [Chaenotheca gracillima]